MISMAALVMAISAFAIAEGIRALYIEPPTTETVFASLLGCGLGSAMVVVSTGWWIYGNPPMLLPANLPERVTCLWQHGSHYCHVHTDLWRVDQ